MSILLVDDNQHTRHAMRLTLLSRSYTVLEASNGRDAMEVLQNSPEVELVITDIQMPIMGGLELIDELREVRPEIPVIAMTGFGSKELVLKLWERKCAGYLETPVKVESLIRKIEKALTAGKDGATDTQEGFNQRSKQLRSE